MEMKYNFDSPVEQVYYPSGGDSTIYKNYVWVKMDGCYWKIVARDVNDTRDFNQKLFVDYPYIRDFCACWHCKDIEHADNCIQHSYDSWAFNNNPNVTPPRRVNYEFLRIDH